MADKGSLSLRFWVFRGECYNGLQMENACIMMGVNRREIYCMLESIIYYILSNILYSLKCTIFSKMYCIVQNILMKYCLILTIWFVEVLILRYTMSS